MKSWPTALVILPFAWLLASSCAAQQPGAIRGAVVDEKGMSVAAALVSVDPLDGVPRSDLVREVETDQRGHFSMDNLELGSYKVFAMKESSGYPNTAFAFYSNHVFLTATLTADIPTVDLTLRVGPPAVIITGLVTDAATNKPLDAAFLLRRTAAPDNWISLSQTAKYRVLVPPLTDVSFEVSAPGYKTYYYGGASDPLRRPPVLLESGQELKLDIQLEPEEKAAR
jgi:hypothetical protein